MKYSEIISTLAGKSTFLRLLAGLEDPNCGYCEFNSNNVEYNYFEQSSADALDLEKTVIESVLDVVPSGYSITEVRTLLSQFMFKGDDVDKKIKVLSGGEKARVALCRMMLKPSNLLFLDEPTNRLDIVSKEVLEDALRHFDGTVVVISHDRYFMSQVAQKIFSFENSTIVEYDCDYHDFISSKEGVKERIESRYVSGDRYKITKAKEVVVEELKTKRNYGGSGVTSGNLFKGVKNAKRYSNSQ